MSRLTSFSESNRGVKKGGQKSAFEKGQNRLAIYETNRTLQRKLFFRYRLHDHPGERGDCAFDFAGLRGRTRMFGEFEGFSGAEFGAVGIAFAEVTFKDIQGNRFDGDVAEGAGYGAHAAMYTFVHVDFDNAGLVHVERSGGADFDTGGVITLLAEDYKAEFVAVAVSADSGYGGDAGFCRMGKRACQFTGTTADTAGGSNYKMFVVHDMKSRS